MLRMFAYVKHEDGTFYMEAEIDEVADAYLLQQLFRNALEVNIGSTCGFGYDERFNDVLEMDYYKDARFRLAYTIVKKQKAFLMTLVEPTPKDKEK